MLTKRDRAMIADGARHALELVDQLGLPSFLISALRHTIVVARARGATGFCWSCRRCGTAGAFYGNSARGADAHLALARFIGVHSGEVCPC